MIAHLQRASDTVGLLAYLYGPGERRNHTSPRLIAGDGHGAPIELLAEPGSLSYLARALDAPVERLGARAPVQPTWVCSVRSDPRRPDLTDSQWATVARSLVSAVGLAPDGDPDACRWIALRATRPGRCTSSPPSPVRTAVSTTPTATSFACRPSVGASLPS